VKSGQAERWLHAAVRRGHGSIGVSLEWEWPNPLQPDPDSGGARESAQAQAAAVAARGAELRAHLWRFAASAAEGS
jgi:hypothetical protein